MESNQIKDISKKLDKIEHNLKDISASLKRISSEANLTSVILACNLPLLVAIEQYTAGTISIEDLGIMFDQSAEIMKKVMNGRNTL